jgi:hypothetical protein
MWLLEEVIKIYEGVEEMFYIILGAILLYIGYNQFKLRQDVEALKENNKNGKDPQDNQDTELFNTEIPYYNGADSND